MSRQIPPASPSRPSARLIAFVTPTIATSVSGTPTHPGRRKSSGSSAPSVRIRTPPRKIITSAAIPCPRNFHPGERFLASSAIPNATMTAAPAR